MHEREQRLARNEAYFREVNERISEVMNEWAAGGERLEFMCECGNAACTATISLTAAEYQSVRSRSRRFVVKPGHESDDVESVVVRSQGHHVVEKTGASGELAERLDRRTG